MTPSDARRERVVTAALAVAARDGWANLVTAGGGEARFLTDAGQVGGGA